MRLQPHLLLLALLLITIGGCATSSSPTAVPVNPSSSDWKTPDVGSKYTIATHIYDPSGFDGFDTSVYVVAATKVSIGGKTNAVHFTSLNRSAVYSSLEPDGDFLLGDSNSGEFRWKRYPTGNHGNIKEPMIDSVAGTEHYYSSTERIYDGTEKLALTAGTFDAIRIKETTTTVATGRTYLFAGYVWIVPSIGYWAKSNLDLSYSTADSVWEGSRWHAELARLELK